MNPPTDPILAAIRREHGSTWRIEFVVEGFDEQFVQVVGGKFNKRFAIVLAQQDISEQLNVAQRHVHFVSAKRES